MATNTPNNDEFLVLTGEDGVRYAIPVDVLEAHRVPEARRAELEQALGPDAAGYMMNYYVTEQLSEQRRAGFLEEAGQARQALQAQASAGAGSEGSGPKGVSTQGVSSGSTGQSLANMISGVILSLPFMRRGGGPQPAAGLRP
jgi:hypothetical protein